MNHIMLDPSVSSTTESDNYETIATMWCGTNDYEVAAPINLYLLHARAIVHRECCIDTHWNSAGGDTHVDTQPSYLLIRVD